jgi:N-acetylmuramic acid 6-phosphate etherase
MATEQISPRFVELDSWSTPDMVEAMYEGQLSAAAAVRATLPKIAGAVEQAVPRMQRGGRLVYVGAGTSGRIAVQDGAELPPTYNWPLERLVFIMAGGTSALLRSSEGAEDAGEDGSRAIVEAQVGPNDVVIGVAASGTTPFTVSAIQTAGDRGGMTVGIANNANTPLLKAAQHAILVETGTEVVAGSTRMQAGTAQKIVLNLFSTSLMIRIGRVYRGLMVDMRARNAKLLRRAEVIVDQIVGCGSTDAARLVAKADGDVKLAVLLGLGLDAGDAAALLQKHLGNLRSAIGELTHEPL